MNPQLFHLACLPLFERLHTELYLQIYDSDPNIATAFLGTAKLETTDSS